MLLSFAYRFFRPLLFFLSPARRLRLFLDLEWIFARFAHEESFRVYPRDSQPLFAGTVAWILARLKPGQKVLDLGCAYGSMSAQIAKAGYEVVGIDHDRASVETAKARFSMPKLSFECADAREFLGRAGVKFDVLVLSQVLEHLDQPEDFLSQFRGFFRYVFIEVPDVEATYLAIYRATVGTRLNYSDSDHVTEFDREELLRVVHAAGLRVAEQESRFGMLRLWCETPGVA